VIAYSINSPVSSEELNELRSAAWPGVQTGDWTEMFVRAFGWVSARDDDRLVGFVRLLWDGDVHVFLLDTTVHRDFQRKGIGTELVKTAIELAKTSGGEWLHVDYEPDLDGFYQNAGFRPTPAGLIALA
jgi:GNAT superfamily N-acetyltransferase